MSTEHFGWSFWEGVEKSLEVNNISLYFKEGFYCICEQGMEPGDRDSIVTGSEDNAYRWFWQCVEDNK
jgi:hypothetical protein